MGFALGVLRLGPGEAWSLTPREIAMAARFMGEPPADAPQRAELEALMARFPDQEGQDGPVR